MRTLLLLLLTVVGLAALGCGGGSGSNEWFDRPDATVGSFLLSGDAAPAEEMNDEDVLARHRAVEDVALAGSHAERLGMIDRQGNPALGVLTDLVVLTGLDDEDNLAELITLGRLARTRYALGIPTGTVLRIQPEFRDITIESGDAPALLIDLEEARWSRRVPQVRDIRISRLTRGSVFSLEAGHIVYAAMRGGEPANTQALESAILGKAFEQLTVQFRIPTMEVPSADGATVWIVTLDKRSMVLPAPGGSGISRAILERRRRAN
jgi:hypothetical protein